MFASGDVSPTAILFVCQFGDATRYQGKFFRAAFAKEREPWICFSVSPKRKLEPRRPPVGKSPWV
jgi:hypothetical protein